MKTSYKIPIIVIPAVLILSFFVINYDNTLDDTPFDVEIIFDAEEYAVKYFVVNGNTDNIEIDIPLDMIDGVFMIYVNDQVVDDERVILVGNKIIVNYGQNIESVKLMGSHDLTECDVGFKNIDGVCKELGKIREKDIPVFFEIQLMELGIEWELADRSWNNPDFEIEPPARICSHIIKESGAELYISTIWQDEYSLSDMIIQRDMPDDCVKFLPVSQIGRK